MNIDPQKPNQLIEQMERLTRHLEALRIADYIQLLEKPWKLITINFIAGVARGLGFALGTTIIFAFVVEGLRRIIMINIPIINNYLIEIFKLMELRK